MRRDRAAMTDAPSPLEAEGMVRNAYGIPVFLPADPTENRPELDALVPLVREGCRGVVDLDDQDWRVVCDALTYQIARRLAKHGQINLPNLGLLEIVYGELGQQGRLILAQEARP